MRGVRASLALFLGLSAFQAAAQTPPPGFLLGGDDAARIEWLRPFAGPGDDWINDIVAIGGDRFLAVGFLGRGEGGDWRALAATLDGAGAVAAAREYGVGGGVDAFWSAAERPGGYAFAGFTTRIGAGGIDAWSVLTDRDGALVGERSFGGDGYDRFTDLAPAGDGFVYLGHSQLPGEERRRLFAVRTDASGAPLWERIIEGPESHATLYIEPAADGGFVVAGGLGRAEDSDMLVLRLDGAGRELWRRTIGTPNAPDVNHGLVLLPNGNIVVVGYSRSWGARSNAILAATLSPAGETLRLEMLDGAEDDRPILARADAAGRVWIIGYTRSAGAGGWDVIVARLDPAGAFEPGAITYGGPGDDNGTAILPLAGGDALIAGYSDGLGGGGEDAFVARLSRATFSRADPAFQRVTIPSISSSTPSSR